MSIQADTLKKIAANLANAAFVRYWLHWNCPTRKPWVMALEIRQWSWQVRGENKAAERGGLVSVRLPELEEYWAMNGLQWDDVDQRYYIDRRDIPEDAT